MYLRWHETEVAVVFFAIVIYISVKELLEQDKIQGRTCPSGVDWVVVVCYWWISCE